MKHIFERLVNLANQSSQIKLYKSDVRDVAKGVGRVIGRFDKELFEFLKFSNGVSVFDYCFLGFKNSKLGIDLDKCMLLLWGSNSRLAGRFIPFMITSTGENFGYLVDFVDDLGRHPVAYYSPLQDDCLYVIGSSFQAFMETFLTDVGRVLDENHGNFIIGIDDPDWPTNISHWLAKDIDLQKNQLSIHDAIRALMPDTNIV